MAVSIKSEKEIELMRVSCKNLSVMFDELEKIIKPGYFHVGDQQGW